MQSMTLVRSSFFDDAQVPIHNSHTRNCLWIKMKNMTPEMYEKYFFFEERLFGGFLIKKSKKHKKLKTRFFVLFKDRLVQCKVNVLCLIPLFY